MLAYMLPLDTTFTIINTCFILLARPGRVVMMPVRKGVKEQHWMIAGESIRNRYNPKEAITLYSKVLLHHPMMI